MKKSVLLLLPMLIVFFPWDNRNVAAQTYVIIKAQFHTHTTYSEGIYSPSQVVQMYHDAGFDCIAITDHNSISGVREANRTAATLGLIIIQGEEIACEFANGESKHIVALFITTVMYHDRTLWGTNNVSQWFARIHAQNGLGFVAHAWNTNNNNIEQWSWYQFRTAKYIDGWETFSYSRGLPQWQAQWLLDQGYICIVDHDFHRGTVNTQRYNLLYCHNRTQAGIKEALINRRLIAYRNGYVLGTPEALALYK